MKDSRFDKTREFNWHAAERDIYDDLLFKENARNKKRKREKKGRKGGGYRLKNIIYAVVFAALAVVSVIYMPFFNIDEIRVVGNSYISAEEACRMAGVYRGEHIFALKTDESQQRLLKDLRIDKASVRRIFPNGLIIEIEERRPVLTVACEYGYIDIDREGLVLAAYHQPPSLPVPLLLDMKVHDLYIGDRVSEPPILAIAAFFGDIGQGVAGLQEVAITDPEHIVCYTPDRTELRIGRLEREKEKATICRDFLSELKTARHQFDYIDLRFETPFVKLRQGDKREPIQYKLHHENRESADNESGRNSSANIESAGVSESKSAVSDSGSDNTVEKTADKNEKSEKNLSERPAPSETSVKENQNAAKKQSDERTKPESSKDEQPQPEKISPAENNLKPENPPSKEPPAPESKNDADARKS